MSEQNDLELYVENARLRNANEKLLAEIDRLRRILAALRDTPCVATRCSTAIAIAAAEQEVGRE